MDIQLVFLIVKRCEGWITFWGSQDERWRVTPRGPMWTVPSMNFNYLLRQEIWSSKKALWVTNTATSLLKPSTCDPIILHWPTKLREYHRKIQLKWSYQSLMKRQMGIFCGGDCNQSSFDSQDWSMWFHPAFEAQCKFLGSRLTFQNIIIALLENQHILKLYV